MARVLDFLLFRLLFFRPVDGLLARKYLVQKPRKGLLFGVLFFLDPVTVPHQLMRPPLGTRGRRLGVTKLQRAADVGLLLPGIWTTWMAPVRKLLLRPTA